MKWRNRNSGILSEAGKVSILWRGIGLKNRHRQKLALLRRAPIRRTGSRLYALAVIAVKITRKHVSLAVEVRVGRRNKRRRRLLTFW